jgi:hypothetical protein
MIPAFKQWLESESHVEMPKIPPPAPNPSPAKPSRPQPSGPVKPGTAPSPALATAPAKETPSRSRDSRPVTAPSSRPVPIAPARPPGTPRPQPLPLDEVDVELVADPGASPFLAPAPLAPEFLEEERPLLEFNRRDWIMLASGAACVLSAVGVGFGLARLMRKKPEEQPEE